MSNSNMNIVNIIKRNKEIEPFQVEKITKVIQWATEGITNVSLVDIEINAKLNLRDGISSKEIHQVLIQSANELISEENPNYQYVAANLLNYQLRKEVWGSINPPKLYDFIQKVIKNNFYDPEIINWYSEKEINKLGDKIDHNRDFLFTYAGIKQLCDKYLIQNRKTEEIYETPQFAYMLISMTAFKNYANGERLDLVKRAYDAFSKHKINLPTPVMAGVRSKMRSYASCCLVDVDDSMDSIFAGNSAVAHATSRRYGIGINLGRMRAIGAKVRGGDVIHTGVIPFLKVFEATVKSCQQNGIRGGGATVNFPIWHFEIEDILQLKNNSGSDDTRVRKMDYSIGFSKLFYERYKNKQNITLFSPHEVKDLYQLFGHPEFDDLYRKYENDPKIEMKKVISAKDLFETFFIKQRLETGRIYVMNVDHANDHGSWLDDVKTSNLCVAPETEITIKNEKGYVVYPKIYSLLDKEVEVWNGKNWSKTKIIKTGTNQKLLKVEIEDNSNNCYKSIYVTEYHKFYLHDGTEVRTVELKRGDKLLSWKLGHSGCENDIIMNIVDENRYDDTYCCNEPEENKVVFNGILTGNCQEVTHPLIPLKTLDDKDAEIGVCILAALNLLEIKNDKDLEETCKMIVLFLDETIDIQEFFNNATKNFATKRRSLAIGITNFAAWLAKHGYNYSGITKEGLEEVDIFFEKMQYYLLKASNELAKVKGKCEYFHKTKYSKGILPIDTYKKDVDQIVKRPFSMDWETLRKDILEFGLRHSTLTAQMPCESSSVIQNTTNGIEPVKSLVTYKVSKSSRITFLVPNINKWKYELCFDMKDNIGYLKLCAIIQKYFDMSISTNTYYNIEHYNGGVPYEKMLKELMLGYKYGIKNFYYNNTNDGHDSMKTIKNNDTIETSSCAGGACTL